MIRKCETRSVALLETNNKAKLCFERQTQVFSLSKKNKKKTKRTCSESWAAIIRSYSPCILIEAAHASLMESIKQSSLETPWGHQLKALRALNTNSTDLQKDFHLHFIEQHPTYPAKRKQTLLEVNCLWNIHKGPQALIHQLLDFNSHCSHLNEM